jgi:hypothetical protein
MLLRGNVDFPSTNEVEALIILSLLNTRAHSRLYSGGCLCSRVCVGVSVGVEIGDASPWLQFELETLLRRSLFRLS